MAFDRVADIVRQATEWYAKLGYPEEWKFHHQGGGTGYGEREYRSPPGSRKIVLDHQAFAMNPTVQGAKTEDTILVRQAEAENLSATLDWPKIIVELDGRIPASADILIQGARQTAW